MNDTDNLILVIFVNRNTRETFLENSLDIFLSVSSISIMKASVRGTITSRAINSSRENTPWSISISSASSVSSLLVNMYSISSRVICSSASSKVAGVKRDKRLVDAERIQTKGLTILPVTIMTGAE